MSLKESLYAGIAMARSGNRIGDIAHAIQEHTEKARIRRGQGNWWATGSAATFMKIPRYPITAKGSGPKLKAGMVLAIEPMINMG